MVYKQGLSHRRHATQEEATEVARVETSHKKQSHRTRLLFIMSMVAVRMASQSIRSRHYFTAEDLIPAGHGTAWDKIFASSSDMGMLHFCGFHRAAFMKIHDMFVVQDPRVHARYQGKTLTGRPPVCDSFTLLAIALFYLTNNCGDKVVPFLLVYAHPTYNALLQHLQLIFGILPAACTRAIWTALDILKAAPLLMREARVTWPSRSRIKR
jgi:hypothetical protein